MKWFFIFLIFFLPFVLANNITNETNISLVNETLNETIVNQSIEINLTLDNVTLEFNLTNETIINETLNETPLLVEEVNDSIENNSFVTQAVFEIASFQIMSLLEGAMYDVGFYEDLILASTLQGTVFSATSYVDSFFGPSITSEGDTFSAYVGSSGNVVTPFLISEEVLSFCGDGTCDSDENCSNCSSDCGECSVYTPLPGGSTGTNLVERNLTLENESVEENISISQNISIPKNISDEEISKITGEIIDELEEKTIGGKIFIFIFSFFFLYLVFKISKKIYFYCVNKKMLEQKRKNFLRYLKRQKEFDHFN